MNSSIDPDYLDAEGYDLACGASANLPDWFVNDLASRGDVLELACGTGRLAIPLAQRGLSVTGLDYSKAMLDRAREKSLAKGVRVEWLLGDIRSYDVGRKFGSVLLLYNAFWHLHERTDVEKCLGQVRRHLKPGGVFVLDVFSPSFTYLTREPGRRYPSYSYMDSRTGKEIKFTETYLYELDKQMAHVVRYLGDTDQVVGGVNLRIYFPQELDALLHYNGMAVRHKYGNWERESFGPASKHQLYFCTAAP